MRLDAPPVSEYSSAKAWVEPDPELGETETVVGVPAVDVTVQEPSCCHPLLAPEISTACRYTFLDPVKAGGNVTVKFSVKVLPLVATVAVATFSEHWLFRNVAADPGVADSHVVAVSFSKLIWLVGAL